jgi:hypothetical protein
MAELLASGHAATAARLLPALLWCLDGDGAVQSAHGTVTTCLRCGRPLALPFYFWEYFHLLPIDLRVQLICICHLSVRCYYVSYIGQRLFVLVSTNYCSFGCRLQSLENLVLPDRKMSSSILMSSLLEM